MDAFRGASGAIAEVHETPKLQELTRIKCLSIRQPWAYLICSGQKDVENRGWSTDHRGPLLIHASKAFDANAAKWLREVPGVVLPDEYVFGAIIGAARLVNCTADISSRWHNDLSIGWYLKAPTLFESPLTCRRRLGLFEVKTSSVPELGAWLEAQS